MNEPIVSYDNAGNRTWLAADERGSIIAAVNASGAASAIYSYDEYGVPAASNAGRFGYTGQVRLPEVVEAGLYYSKNRMYLSPLGRFPQPDPIGYAGGANLYPYVGNDSVNLADPLGLQQVSNSDIVVTGLRPIDPLLATGALFANITAIAVRAAEAAAGEGDKRDQKDQCQQLAKQVSDAQKAFDATGAPMGGFLGFPNTWNNPQALEAELSDAQSNLASDESVMAALNFLAGTTFASGKATYAASKAVHEGVTVGGVIHELVSGVPFTATLEFGRTTLNGQMQTLAAKAALIQNRLKQLQAQAKGQCPS